MINGHGDDIQGYESPIVSNFSSNVFYGAGLSGLKRHLVEQIALIRNYPEAMPYTLEQKLAGVHGVPAGSVSVTNGATEAIYLIAQSFRGSHSVILQPAFSEYEDACCIHSHTITSVYSLDDLPAGVELVWICNPNNPTGCVTDKAYLCELILSRPDILFVVDQSYEHFTLKDLFTVAEGISFPNLILLHSMTKRYAIPGLRLGYLTAPERLAERIRSNRMPWSVNQMSIQAGLYLLENDLSPAMNLIEYLQETARLKEMLEVTGRVEVFPTDAHFMLCRLKDGKASALKEFLANRYGILIRDASNFKGLDESYFRIATQMPEENVKLVAYIKEWAGR